jgi:hypothetical protein
MRSLRLGSLAFFSWERGLMEAVSFRESFSIGDARAVEDGHSWGILTQN